MSQIDFLTELFDASTGREHPSGQRAGVRFGSSRFHPCSGMGRWAVLLSLTRFFCDRYVVRSFVLFVCSFTMETKLYDNTEGTASESQFAEFVFLMFVIRFNWKFYLLFWCFKEFLKHGFRCLNGSEGLAGVW